MQRIRVKRSPDITDPYSPFAFQSYHASANTTAHAGPPYLIAGIRLFVRPADVSESHPTMGSFKAFQNMYIN